VPESNQNPLLLAWQNTLARFGNAPAILSESGTVLRTFMSIGLEAVKLGKVFERIPAHSVVAVQMGNSERWPELLLALWKRKLIPLPLGDMTPTDLAITLGTCHAAALVTQQAGPVIVHRRPVPEDATRWTGGPPPDFLKLTSGTTSTPRAVRFRASQLLADCENICSTMGITDLDINYGVIPFTHSYGFSNLITPLLVRGTKLVVSSDRLPRAILEGIAATGATVFPGTPVLFQKLSVLNDVDKPPDLRLCISAGAPLPKSAASVFSVRFGLKIHSFYGSSECGGIAYDGTEDRLYEEGFVGTPMKGVEVALSDSPGPIAVRGPAVGDGYFPKSDESVLGRGRFVPGDIVNQTERGFYLVGRTTEVINVAGRKLNPLEIEARLAEFPGVKQAVVFGVESALRGEEPVACVAGEDLGREELMRFCQENMSPWQVPRDLWLVGEIPSTERGKINRRAVAESYRAQKSKSP
jgi:long-chain acyl-CoA synthetase